MLPIDAQVMAMSQPDIEQPVTLNNIKFVAPSSAVTPVIKA